MAEENTRTHVTRRWRDDGSYLVEPWAKIRVWGLAALAIFRRPTENDATGERDAGVTLGGAAARSRSSLLSRCRPRHRPSSRLWGCPLRGVSGPPPTRRQPQLLRRGFADHSPAEQFDLGSQRGVLLFQLCLGTAAHWNAPRARVPAAGGRCAGWFPEGTDGLERHDQRRIFPAFPAGRRAIRRGVAQEARDLLDMTAVEAYAPAHVIRRRRRSKGPQKFPNPTGSLSRQRWCTVHHATNVLSPPFSLLLAAMISSCELILGQWRAVAFVIVRHMPTLRARPGPRGGGSLRPPNPVRARGLTQSYLAVVGNASHPYVSFPRARCLRSPCLRTDSSVRPIRRSFLAIRKLLNRGQDSLHRPGFGCDGGQRDRRPALVALPPLHLQLLRQLGNSRQ